MIKLIFYTVLFGVGGYAVVTRLPDSYKEKMLSAIGLGQIQGQSFSVFNPTAKRDELIKQLEENIARAENAQNANASKTESSPEDSDKNISIEGPALPPQYLAPFIEEQKGIIEKLKELNPQTGILPKIMEKVLGLEQKPSETELQKIISQISPKAKAAICGVQ